MAESRAFWLVCTFSLCINSKMCHHNLRFCLTTRCPACFTVSRSSFRMYAWSNLAPRRNRRVRFRTLLAGTRAQRASATSSERFCYRQSWLLEKISAWGYASSLFLETRSSTRRLLKGSLYRHVCFMLMYVQGWDEVGIWGPVLRCGVSRELSVWTADTERFRTSVRQTKLAPRIESGSRYSCQHALRLS